MFICYTFVPHDLLIKAKTGTGPAYDRDRKACENKYVK